MSDDQMSLQEIERQLAAAAAKKSAAHLPKGDKGRRKGEAKTKGRVNENLLRPGGAGRDALWSFRVNPAHRKAVEQLAAELSAPKAKVSVAALMGEAIELLLAHYQQEPEP
jgi:hypothetical protein